MKQNTEYLAETRNGRARSELATEYKFIYEIRKKKNNNRQAQINNINIQSKTRVIFKTSNAHRTIRPYIIISLLTNISFTR